MMLSDVLRNHRKEMKLTQDEIAEKIGVSRQSVAKWESGQSVPDIFNCQALCRLFNIRIDDLLQSDYKNETSLTPKGKHIFGYLLIEEDNKIRLPEECLNVMKHKKGDYLLCLADEEQGIALVEPKTLEKFASEIMKAQERINDENNKD